MEDPKDAGEGSVNTLSGKNMHTHISRDRRLRIFSDAEMLAAFFEECLEKRGRIPSEEEVMLRFKWSPRQTQPRYRLAKEILRKKRIGLNIQHRALNF